MRADTRSFATRVLLVAGVAMAALAILAALWYAVNILLTVFAGLLLAVALGGLAEWAASRTGLRRGVALAIVVVTLLGVMAGGAWAIGATAAEQSRELIATLPKAVEHLKATLGENAVGRFLLERIPDASAGSEQAAKRSPWWALTLTLDVITGIALMAFIALFVAADPDVYARGVVRLLPQGRRRRARQVLAELDERMRRWLLGKLVTMIIIAVVTWAGLALIGVKLALALGILAGLLNFIPYIGPLIAFVPAMLLALMQGVGTVGAVAGLWVGVQTLEGYVLTPLVDQQAVDVPPALELAALAVAGTTMGTMGVVLGAPLTAVIFVLVQRLYVEDALGDDIDAPVDEPRTRAA
jgi:predicted PurR-regulated permease PerM